LTGPESASTARKAAQQILKEPRFHTAPVPRPLHGLLQAIGEAFAFLPDSLDRLVAAISGAIPGGSAVVWGILAALLLTLVAVAVRRMTRRLLDDPTSGGRYSHEAPAPSTSELELAAVLAEREGRLADAVRLRFQGGLLGLGERHVIDFAPSMANAEVSRALRSERFDALARRFDEIVYGGSPAKADDVVTARQEWRQLLSSKALR
jgi:hypothetical protein